MRRERKLGRKPWEREGDIEYSISLFRGNTRAQIE